MALTPAKIRNVNAIIDTMFMQARQNVPTNWRSIVRKKKLAIGKGLYSGQDDVPAISRKGPDGYPFADVASKVYELNSDYFGSGLKMLAAHARDDLYGIYDKKIMLLGRRIERFPDEVSFNLLKEGDQTAFQGRNIKWIDNLAFFHATHLLNVNDAAKGTFKNLYTATALTPANFAIIYAKLMEMADTEGKKMGLVPNRLIVPPALWKTAADILEAPTISTGGYNVEANEALTKMGKSKVEIVVEPELAGDDGIWYLAAVEGSGADGVAAGPLIWQETEQIIIHPKIDPKTDDNLFFDDELLWLAKGASEFGWDDARRIIRCEA